MSHHFKWRKCTECGSTVVGYLQKNMCWVCTRKQHIKQLRIRKRNQIQNKKIGIEVMLIREAKDQECILP